MINVDLSLFGKKCSDKVTGFTGIISSISMDLYGCVQVVLTPPVNKKGEIQDSRWFDVSRLQIISNDPVMEVPEFNIKKGPAEKPLFQSNPIK